MVTTQFRSGRSALREASIAVTVPRKRRYWAAFADASSGLAAVPAALEALEAVEVAAALLAPAVGVGARFAQPHATRARQASRAARGVTRSTGRQCSSPRRSAR